MIHVSRQQTDVTGAPVRPDASWFKAASEAKARACVECDKHDADRAVYAHAGVRQALERLFRCKCAYCESSIANADWDVDHFRPKGAVAERPDHPGYYWLAYEWSNLYPACVFCNQRRREKALWDDDAPPGAGGKAEHFPLRDEDRRAMTHEAASAVEQPLLLDPCEDDPESYLKFGANGEAIPLVDDERAKTTIAILFLDRKRLRDRRKQAIVRVTDALAVIAKFPQTRADLEAWLVRHCVGDGCEYAAAARAVQRDPTAFGL